MFTCLRDVNGRENSACNSELFSFSFQILWLNHKLSHCGADQNINVHVNVAYIIKINLWIFCAMHETINFFCFLVVFAAVERLWIFTELLIYSCISPFDVKIMNSGRVITNALCFHLIDGLHLAKTLEKLSFYEPHLFWVTGTVQVQHSACSRLIIASHTLQSDIFERWGGVSPVETLQRYPCSALQTQTHLFWSVINGSN